MLRPISRLTCGSQPSGPGVDEWGGTAPSPRTGPCAASLEDVAEGRTSRLTRPQRFLNRVSQVRFLPGHV
jgi:hypothetical protein